MICFFQKKKKKKQLYQALSVSKLGKVALFAGTFVRLIHA